jgi:hypothetical protein
MRIARTVLLSLLLCSAPCAAQTVDSTEEAFALAQAGAVPPFVVPVLRLVSKTHVEPTTGIVISDSGLVLVPAGFASAGDEIVVLDGGTDIVSNGRTARIEKNFPMDGLQVLSVYGLRRPGAPFADGELQDGDEVRLTAFPPAEQIAEGAQPLDIQTTVTVFGENRPPAITGETPLPNVTGPLLDACGNVSALSLANDIQTMETSPGTRYKWRDTLLGVLEHLGIRPAPTACTEAVTDPESAIEEELPLPAEEPTPEPVPEEVPPEPEPEATEEESLEEEIQQPDEELVEVLPPIETDDEPVMAAEDEPEPSTGWAWLLLTAVLVSAATGLHFWRRSLGQRDDPEEDSSTAAPPDLAEDEDPAWQQPVMDSRLKLEGSLADGRPIEADCPASSDAINVVIGRGGADLRIDSAAVSRQHAALNGTATELTITDLGSNNGTSINGVPCLEGEIMYLEPGDTVILGDARFTLTLDTSSGDKPG